MKIAVLEEEFPHTPNIDRSPGCHLSDVLSGMGEELFKIPGKKDGEVVNADTLMQFEKGFLWEETLSLAMKERLATRPGEILCDGIACSPDGVGVDGDGELVVEEYKATTMSSNKTPDQLWKWKWQAGAYCHVVGATRAIFRVLYLCGDYRTFIPTYRVYRLDFSEGELQDMWEAVVGFARRKGWVDNG